MLILTRKVGESLIIADDIKVTICAQNKSQIRVGIQAPKDIQVHREEVYIRIKTERENTEKNNPYTESAG